VIAIIGEAVGGSNGAGVVPVSIGEAVGGLDGAEVVLVVVGEAVGGSDGVVVGVSVGGSVAEHSKKDSSYLAVSKEAQPRSSTGKNPINFQVGRMDVSCPSHTYDRTGLSAVPWAGYSAPKDGAKW